MTTDIEIEPLVTGIVIEGGAGQPIEIIGIGAQGPAGSPGSGGSSSYVLPPATPTTLGGVKQGSNVSIATDGTLTVPSAAFDANGAAAAAAAGVAASLAPVATSGSYADLSNKPALGTAAAQNIGTAAGNVVALDGAGKLPAVDGSQLTNLPSGGGGSGSFTSATTGSVPLRVTAATGQTANLLEIITPGIVPSGSRSGWGPFGEAWTQAWMTISGLYVANPDGSLKEVIYPGGTKGSPKSYIGNRINGSTGGMLGVSNDIVGPNIALQDNQNTGGGSVAVVAAVAAGGTGYAVGDVLTASGGTSTAATPTYADSVQLGGTGYAVGNVLTIVGGAGTAATVTVTSVSAGAVTGVSLTSAGSYSVYPPITCPVTGGTGSGAYINMIWPSKGAAKVKVTSVSGGVITGLAVVRPGLYTATPGNPVALTGGTGTGATATVTWSGLAQMSRHIEALDYTRSIRWQMYGDGSMRWGNQQDIEDFVRSKATIRYVDDDNMASDATWSFAGVKSNGDAQVGNMGFRTVKRTMTATAADTVNIGSFNVSDVTGGTGQSMGLVLLVSVITHGAGGGAATAKTFRIVTSYNSTSGAWQIVPPMDAQLQPGSTADWALDVNVTNLVVSLRLRSVTNPALTAYVGMVVEGLAENAVFRASSATASGVAVPTVYLPSNSASMIRSNQAVFTPTTGGTVTLAHGTPVNIIKPAGTLAALTVALPAGPVDGQEFELWFTQAITTLTISASGASVTSNITSAAINQMIRLKYYAAAFTWHCVK